MLTSASDSIKRTVGIDIRRAMGGKTAAEIAEERLKNEYGSNPPAYLGGGGYQGINLPVSAFSEPKINQQDLKVGQKKWKPDDDVQPKKE